MARKRMEDILYRDEQGWRVKAAIAGATLAVTTILSMSSLCGDYARSVGTRFQNSVYTVRHVVQSPAQDGETMVFRTTPYGSGLLRRIRLGLQKAGKPSDNLNLLTLCDQNRDGYITNAELEAQLGSQ